jgi:sigma-E factor negative regulatory protein RseA
METREKTQEQISALADDELSDSQVEVALAALRDPEARADWDLYHQIGDILRSDDMAISLSEGFSARMAARLEAEPSIVAPQAAPRPAVGHPAMIERVKRFAMPGMAAAAVATAVFMTAPQMLVAKKDSGSGAGPAVAMVAAKPAPAVVAVPVAVGAAVSAEREVAAAEQGEVLRDPRIDEYLMAHQRFSPSVYSSAQYARSATFAADTGK